MRYLYAIAALFLLLPLSCGASMQGATAMEAWVVDADTGEPIEGVNVVAHWQAERGVPTLVPVMPIGNDPRGPLQLKIMETVTDGAGRFSFPAWGPVFVPPLAGLLNADPEIIMFKDGYRAYMGMSDFDAEHDYSKSSTRTPWADGQKIKLKKFEGDLRSYSSNLGMLGTFLDFALQPRFPNCDWAQIPLMLRAIFKEEALFKAKRIGNSIPDGRSIRNPRDCDPAAVELLKEYIP